MTGTYRQDKRDHRAGHPYDPRTPTEGQVRTMRNMYGQIVDKEPRQYSPPLTTEQCRAIRDAMARKLYVRAYEHHQIMTREMASRTIDAMTDILEGNCKHALAELGIDRDELQALIEAH